MLKVDAAIDLMESVFSVKADMFDPEAVRDMQVAKRAAGPQGRRLGPQDEEDRGSKVQKTVLEQDVSVANKAGL